MRKITLILVILVALISCDTKQQTEYTPAVAISFPIKQSGDTLFATFNPQTNTVLFDTITESDTISFGVAFDAIGNYLTQASITSDTSLLSLSVPLTESIRQVLETPDDTLKNIYHIKIGYRMLTLPLTLSPRQSQDTTTTLTLSALSDINTANQITIKIPLR